MKILVVDDEPLIVKSLSAYLRLKGYDVVGCESPAEALRRAGEENIQVVVSDVLMPEMDGVELLRRLKQQNGFCQVILITGFVRMDKLLEAFQGGANNIFFKPLEALDELGNEIDRAFHKLKRIQEVLREQRGMLKAG